MPITSSFSGASARALGLTSSGYTAIGNGYWINRTSKASTNVYSWPKSMTVDSSGNMYYAGYNGAYPSGSDFSQNIVKYSSTGEIAWQRKIDTPGIIDVATSVSLDSSGNVYLFGLGVANSYGTYFKFNSSGVLQWQKKLTDAYIYVYPQDSIVDSSGNIYLCGATYNNTTNTYDATIIKFDSSGNIVWQRRVYSNDAESFSGIALDSSNNVYLTGSTGPAGGAASKGIVFKYNSSGSLQWQRELSSLNTVDSQAVVCDSAGAVYIALNYKDSSGGTQFGSLIKYNSSGVLQWQKKITYSAYGTTTSRVFSQSLSLDSSDNLYVISPSLEYVTSGGVVLGSPTLIQKFNSSGVEQWARNFNLDNSGSGGYATIAINGNDYYIYFNSQLSNPATTIGAKLPIDGSKTGKYSVDSVNITYNTITTTITSGTLTDAAGGLTDTSGSIISSNAGITDTANDLTTVVRD